MSGPAGSGQTAAAGAALVTAQSGMSALADSRNCPDSEIDGMGHKATSAIAVTSYSSYSKYLAGVVPNECRNMAMKALVLS